MAELLYYADNADRIYQRTTRVGYQTVGDAVRASRALPAGALVDVRYNNGASVPVAYRDLVDQTADPDAVIRHRFADDGWTAFQEAPVTLDGDNVFDLSVVNHRGRIASDPGSTEGNSRFFYLRDGTRWPDSDITSLWWGPSSFTTSGDVNRPQMGHVHGAYVGDDGRLRAAVVWFNIFGATLPNGLLMNMWEADGTNLWLGASTGNGPSTNAVDRAALVLWAQRFTFGFTFIQARLHPHWAADTLVAGSTGDLAGMAQSSLNGTGLTVTGGAEHQGMIQLQVPTAADLTDAVAGGTWTPDPIRRVCPYYVRSRWVPPVMMIKQWAYGRVEPDWGGPHTAVATISVDADTLMVPDGPGMSGFAAGHAWAGSSMEYGDALFQRAA